MATSYVVSAVECSGMRRYRECGVRAESEAQARRRAVAKWYGPSVTWHADQGLGANYGQVVARDGNCLTDRIRIDVGTAATTVRHKSDGEEWQTTAVHRESR